MPAKTSERVELQILALQYETVDFCVLGTQPLIFNRMAKKAKEILLVGGQRKTAAEKAAAQKHNPLAEFLDSMNRHETDRFPTRLWMKPEAFKGALRTAALEMPGTKKTEIGRLTYVEGTRVDIWGVPKLYMDVVRSADINRTPDIRTRAKLERWAARVSVRYARPKLNATSIANLMAAAGLVCGVGDFRQEKGAGNFGMFDLVAPDHPEFQDIVLLEGRAAQDAAIETPACYDSDTAELLEFWHAETKRRGDTAAAPAGPAARRRRAANGLAEAAAGSA